LRDGLATEARQLHNVVLGYEEVLRRDFDRGDEAEIRQDIVAIAMIIERYPLALDHLRILLEGESHQGFRENHPDQVAELFYQQGQCHHAEGRFSEAFESYLRALELGDKQHKFYLPLAALFAD